MKPLVACICLTLAFPLMAAEPTRATVEGLLRVGGFVPASRPSVGVDSAIAVSGTSSKPEFRQVPCRRSLADPAELRRQGFVYRADNRGEFGGEFTVRGATAAPRVLIHGNVWHLIPSGDDLYVFSGLDHLHAGDGSMHVVENFGTRPEVRHLTELPDMPYVVVEDPDWGGFLVLSDLTVTLVRHRGQLDLIMARHAGLWGVNSVRSIGYADLLIGVCGGVAWLHAPWLLNMPPDRDFEIPIVTFWRRPE